MQKSINKFIYGKNHGMIKYTTSSTIYKILLVSGQHFIEETEKWYFPDSALATPTLPIHTTLKGKDLSLQYAQIVQNTPHSQTHSLKLWQFQENSLKILLEKQVNDLFENTKPEDILSFSKKRLTFH